MEILIDDCRALAQAADTAIAEATKGKGKSCKILYGTLTLLTLGCIKQEMSMAKANKPYTIPEDIYALPEPTTTVGEVLVAIACVAVALAAAGYGLRYALSKRSSREQAVAALAERLPDNAAEIAAIAETVSGEPCEHCEAEGKAHIELQPAQQAILNAAIVWKTETWLDCAGGDMPIEDEMLLKEALFRATNKRTNGCLWSEAEIMEKMRNLYHYLVKDSRHTITKKDLPILREMAIAELNLRIKTKTFENVQY